MAAAIAVNLLLLGASIVAPILEKDLAKPTTNQYTVRITAGQTAPGDDAANTGGPAPSVSLFDVDGALIGIGDGCGAKTEPGSFHQHLINPLHNNAEVEYVSITASGSDAFCVSIVTIQSPSGTTGAWNGDWAYACDAPWYPSKAPLPGSRNAQPRCVWMSNDGRFPQGYSFHPADFASPGISGDNAESAALGQQYSNNRDTLCKVPFRQGIHHYMNTGNYVAVFPDGNLPRYNANGTDEDPEGLINVGAPNFSPAPGVPMTIANFPQFEYNLRGNCQSFTFFKRAGVAGRREKRSPAAVSRHACDDRLVISSYEVHSAKEVCESPSSWGPDFVSVAEGVYCDMCAKKTWPLCGGSRRDRCFDLGSHLLVPGNGTLGRRAGEAAMKKYVKIENWG